MKGEKAEMIKNIVFDMGKVLVDYDPEKTGRRFVPEDEKLRREISTVVFDSQEWVLLDMGVISEEQALARMQARLDTPKKRELAALFLAHWHEYNMHTREGMEQVVREMKNRGFGIYLCSNASLRLLECWRTYLPAPECFDGVLFSAQVRCIKPQKEMYAHFFERFGLKPEECFFIDDLAMNIEGGRACGMDGYCFADGEIERLKERLAAL